jgi:poly(ADP-ribose) glycohydrolase ARH3
MMDLKSKYLGGMLGSAIGDAIGELAFRCPEREKLVAQIELEKELQYTDDTAMAIGLAESILEKGNIDQLHLGDVFRRNFHREPWRGYAPGPPTLFSMVERTGLTYKEAARSLFGGTGSFGNGAAMRIAPLALHFHASSELYREASASAEVTHAHPIGMDGAAVQAKAIALAASLDPAKPFSSDDFIQDLESFSRSHEIRQKMALLKTLRRQQAASSVAFRRLGQSVAVHESMPFAIYAFLRYPHSFEECLFCAVLHGGDRDTLGAMACAVAGAYLGADALPLGWRDKLENRPYIESLASQLPRMVKDGPQRSDDRGQQRKEVRNQRSEPQ